MKRYKTVDEYMKNADLWWGEQQRLREILLSTGLTENLKWGGPVYTCDGQNVVGIGGFKSCFGLWFFQGALLNDDRKVLVNAQEGTTKALRQWRMQSAKDIEPAQIKAYVREAVDLVKAGKKVGPDRKKPIIIPPELEEALAINAKARKAFHALRPGLQREFTNYVASAKRDVTKQKRVDKILPMIAAGKGLNDKYR